MISMCWHWKWIKVTWYLELYDCMGCNLDMFWGSNECLLLTIYTFVMMDGNSQPFCVIWMRVVHYTLMCWKSLQTLVTFTNCYEIDKKKIMCGGIASSLAFYTALRMFLSASEYLPRYISYLLHRASDFESRCMRGLVQIKHIIFFLSVSTSCISALTL